MSVYQVEQFYIHLSTKGCDSKLLAKITELLHENNCTDYEFQGCFLVIDGFESECDAVNIEELIHGLIVKMVINRR